MVPFTQGPGADGLDVEAEWSEKRGECGSPVGEALEQRTATEPHKEPTTNLAPSQPYLHDNNNDQIHFDRYNKISRNKGGIRQVTNLKR